MCFSEIWVDLDGSAEARLCLAFEPARCRDITTSEPIGCDVGPQRRRSFCCLRRRVEPILLAQRDRQHVPSIRHTGVSSEHFTINLLRARHCACLVEPYRFFKNGADFSTQHYAGFDLVAVTKSNCAVDDLARLQG